MLFYFSIYILLLPFVFRETKSYRKKQRIPILCFTFLFFVLSFIRWKTGTDWENYYQTFRSISIPFDTLDDPVASMEPGYMFLVNLAKYISDSYTINLLLVAIVVYYFFYKGFRKLSPYPLFSLFVFYCINLGGIFFVRQTIAMSIIFFSIRYIEKKKVKLFVIFVFLASLFHRTSLIFLPVYYIYNLHLPDKKLFLYTSIACVIGSILSTSLLLSIGTLGIGVISNRIDLYLDLGNEGGGPDLSGTAYLLRGLINRLFVIFFCYLYLKKARRKNKRINGCINLYLIGVVFFVTLTPISKELARISAYFDMAQYLLYPYIIYQCPKKNKKILLLFFFLFFAFRLYSFISPSRIYYIPYISVFSK